MTVTFDSLCTLTQQYSSKQDVADDLCAFLAAAKNALARNDPKGEKRHVDNYVKTVTKQTGKAFTQDEAETLVRLAGGL